MENLRKFNRVTLVFALCSALAAFAPTPYAGAEEKGADAALTKMDLSRPMEQLKGKWAGLGLFQGGEGETELAFTGTTSMEIDRVNPDGNIIGRVLVNGDQIALRVYRLERNGNGLAVRWEGQTPEGVSRNFTGKISEGVILGSFDEMFNQGAQAVSISYSRFE